jgi:hypothetical protein
MVASALINYLLSIVTVYYALVLAYQNVFICQLLIAETGSPGTITTSDANAGFKFCEDDCAIGTTIADSPLRLLVAQLWSCDSGSHFRCIPNLGRGFMNLSEQSVSNDQWNQRGLNPLQHANSGNWILARNQYLKMGRIAFEEWRLDQALNLFLYVCVLDLNGAQDQADLPDHLSGNIYNFNTGVAFLAPDVVEDLGLIAEVTGIKADDLKTCYFRIASAKFLPVPAQKSWSVLALALEGKIDPNDRPRWYMQIQERINEQKFAISDGLTIQTIRCWFKYLVNHVSRTCIGCGRGKLRQRNETIKTTMIEMNSPQNVRRASF